MTSSWTPCLGRSSTSEGCPLTLGHELVDNYLRLVWARTRPNTLLAVAFDLKVFFTIVAKDPLAVRPGDVFGFVEAQRRPRRGDNVVRLEDVSKVFPRGRSSGGSPACPDCSTI